MAGHPATLKRPFSCVLLLFAAYFPYNFFLTSFSSSWDFNFEILSGRISFQLDSPHTWIWVLSAKFWKWEDPVLHPRSSPPISGALPQRRMYRSDAAVRAGGPQQRMPPRDRFRPRLNFNWIDPNKPDLKYNSNVADIFHVIWPEAPSGGGLRVRFLDLIFFNFPRFYRPDSISWTARLFQVWEV